MNTNANDHRITWCLNWGEDAVSGWSACYCVSPDCEETGLDYVPGENELFIWNKEEPCNS